MKSSNVGTRKTKFYTVSLSDVLYVKEMIKTGYSTEALSKTIIVEMQ